MGWEERRTEGSGEGDTTRGAPATHADCVAGVIWRANAHTHTQARTHARVHTHAHTHAHTHTHFVPATYHRQSEDVAYKLTVDEQGHTANVLPPESVAHFALEFSRVLTSDLGHSVGQGHPLDCGNTSLW